MENLNAGSQIELKDGSTVTITEVKTEITYEKDQDGNKIAETLPLDEFQKRVKTDEKELSRGLKFIDTDKASSEILEITDNLILYKKQYGADSWNNSISVQEFREKVKAGQIILQ